MLLRTQENGDGVENVELRTEISFFMDAIWRPRWEPGVDDNEVRGVRPANE